MRIALTFLILSSGAPWHAEDSGTRPAPIEVMAGSADVPMHVEKPEQLQPLASELFGDQVSLYTGQTSFGVMHISGTIRHVL